MRAFYPASIENGSERFDRRRRRRLVSVLYSRRVTTRPDLIFKTKPGTVKNNLPFYLFLLLQFSLFTSMSAGWFVIVLPNKARARPLMQYAHVSASRH